MGQGEKRNSEFDFLRYIIYNKENNFNRWKL